jgi:hypothetical protein
MTSRTGLFAKQNKTHHITEPAIMEFDNHVSREHFSQGIAIKVPTAACEHESQIMR